MTDRQNRKTDEPRQEIPESDPSMDEKDTSEERQYDEKSGREHPEPTPSKDDGSR